MLGQSSQHFYNFAETGYKLKRTGVQVKTISGERVQMQLVKLQPGFISDHHHPHEQMGYVVRGEIELTIDSETQRCGPGCAYHIPADSPHSFRVLSDYPIELLEVFSPPKEENRL